MKKVSLFILTALLLFISACAVRKMTVASGDGSSFEKAVVITETSEKQGVDAEYIWIRKTYPDAKTSSQSLTYHDKKPYDILHITTADGKAMAVYFDISNFYGKF